VLEKRKKIPQRRCTIRKSKLLQKLTAKGVESDFNCGRKGKRSTPHKMNWLYQSEKVAETSSIKGAKERTRRKGIKESVKPRRLREWREEERKNLNALRFAGM